MNKIKLLCVLASQDGLDRVQKEYPGVEVSSDIHLSIPSAHWATDLGVCGRPAIDTQRTDLSRIGRHGTSLLAASVYGVV